MSDNERLRNVVKTYIKAENYTLVPDYYYEMMLKVWSSMNHLDRKWDAHSAASVLLSVAVREGNIQLDQITTAGEMALDWASNYVEDTDVVILLGQYQKK